MNFQTWLSIIGVIVGSGAVGYAIRLLIRIAILEELFEDKKIEIDRLTRLQEASNTRMSLIELSLTDLKSVMDISSSNNRKLIEISTSLVSITDAIKVIVPRAEIEYHWRAYDQGIQDIKNVSLKLSDKVDSVRDR